MDSDQEEYFPGLNKKHGFFRVIERNQVSRDEYHKKHELWKEEKKNELDTEISTRQPGRRRRSKDDRKPDRMVYQPPSGTRNHRSSHHQKAVILYRLEIEVKPGIIWTKEIDRYGREKSLAHSAAIDYHLDNSTEDALRIFIKEFEMKLKFKEL